jgi:hypothetical protein
MAKEFFGFLFLMTVAIAGFTNIVSDEWNLWGLMVKLGGTN